MDASVNMKMTPAEHRLLREAVEEAKEWAAAISANTVALCADILASENSTPRDRRKASEREAQLAAILERL